MSAETVHGRGPGQGARPPRLTERILAVVNRDPRDAPHQLRKDLVLVLFCVVHSVVLAFVTAPAGSSGQEIDSGHRPEGFGWVLLVASALPLLWRRHHSGLCLLAVIALILPYHTQDFAHSAPSAQTYIALYTVGATSRPVRTLVVGIGLLGLILTVMWGINPHEAMEFLRTAGWVFASLFLGFDVRIYRQYVASIVERAERAERTREEEAARRVAEERLRIARDLHDLLAHSITLIGVQTSVASHVLTVDPERLDREAIAKALDDISETCRTARGELRSTLEVLREAELPDGRGALPGLDGLPDLAASARTAGARVTLSVAVEAEDVPAAVGAAVYRIVQEALTNAVRHAGQGVRIAVSVRPEGSWGLRLSVEDDGPAGAAPPVTSTSGYGLVGMRERVRSVGGTLDAAPREQGGFAVRAVLPLRLSQNGDVKAAGVKSGVTEVTEAADSRTGSVEAADVKAGSATVGNAARGNMTGGNAARGNATEGNVTAGERDEA
ncbi:sensor histidine kinase [Streptomyces indicus]|uniref:histidine kinase n=1 Tax=Streptomyces indicus TaxID=417292 RepID=A0A1G9DB37_9ACTN|nr:sensor histidine kinase [Streptomyces indicus]SDK61080.1 Signal transduction histidine kinase [Streptomyces indicus]